MGDLHRLQRAVARTLSDAAHDGAVCLVRAGTGPGAAARLSIYRNNVEQARLNALRLTYPVVLELVGENCFRQFARTYAREVPSRSGNLEDYGGGFGDFLAAHEDFHRLPWLADVAVLEWTVHEACQAAPPRSADCAWSEIAAADPDAVHVRMDPSCRLVHSMHPVGRIWRMHQGSVAHRDTAIDAGPARLLVVQHGQGALVQPLEAAEFAFADACRSESSLAGACEAALEADPGVDLGHCMHTLIRLGALSARVVHAPVPEEEPSHAIT